MQHSITKVGYAVPIVIVIGLFASYMMAPDFYLAHILNEENREQGALEIVTFGSAFIGGILLVASSWRLWKSGNWLAAGVVGSVSAATLFFAGEEIGWGQIHLAWETPTWWKEHFGGSTDLHSGSLPIPILAGIFLFTIFFLLPLAWKFQPPFHLPKALKPAIPEGPVIFTIAFATIYREFKGVYSWLNPSGYQDRLYAEFLWGLNEHKEMLIALAMLLYALYRLPLLKQVSPPK